MDAHTRALAVDFTLAASAAVVDARRPASLVLAVATTLSVGLVLVLGWRVVVSPAAGLLLGTGVGLAGYRVGFGVVGPLPEKRRLQAGGSTASTVGEGS